MGNRLGFTNFITDKDKIDKYYEDALDAEYPIDRLDHLMLALVDELGKEKETELELSTITMKAQLKIIQSLKADLENRICDNCMFPKRIADDENYEKECSIHLIPCSSIEGCNKFKPKGA